MEVAPLVSSVNDLLTRLKIRSPRKSAFWPTRRTSSRRRWPACACRPTWRSARASAEELKQSLQQIGRSSIRATHTVNQLLALARAESSGTPWRASPATWRS
jgi:two-component system sensor histidine kinase TctE